jgi:hypothetical protein
MNKKNRAPRWFIAGKMYTWVPGIDSKYYIQTVSPIASFRERQQAEEISINTNECVVMLEVEWYKEDILAKILTENGRIGWVRISPFYVHEWKQVTGS